ncbi:Leucine-rich repeat-containing protein 49, partial [Chytridiales sp. JEL 0842]
MKRQTATSSNAAAGALRALNDDIEVKVASTNANPNITTSAFGDYHSAKRPLTGRSPMLTTPTSSATVRPQAAAGLSSGSILADVQFAASAAEEQSTSSDSVSTVTPLPRSRPTSASTTRAVDHILSKAISRAGNARLGVDFYERSQDDREADPERLNLNRRDLQACMKLLNEDNLRLLNYQSNYISKIEWLDNLKNLVFLDFYNNNIERISGLESLSNLRVLMLGRNKIHRIENLECVPKLDVLDLHSNMVSKIENISHLSELRVLNLEDNHIQVMDSLPRESLTELNLKRNQIQSIKNAQTLKSLRRLVLSTNYVTAFEHIADLLLIPELIELSLEANEICQDQYYRPILVNRIRSLKILDGKRITEEEKRGAARIAKRESERRKEHDRAATQFEERKRAILQIKASWETEMLKLSKKTGQKDATTQIVREQLATTRLAKSAPSQRSNRDIPVSEGSSVDSTGALVFLQNNILSMYGDALHTLDKVEPNPIYGLSFNYIQYEKIVPHLPKLKKFTNLDVIEFSNTNIHSLKQLNYLSGLKLPKPVSLVVEQNPVISCPLFLRYTVFQTSQLPIKAINGIDVTRDLISNAETIFGALKRALNSNQEKAANDEFKAFNSNSKAGTEATLKSKQAAHSYIERRIYESVEVNTKTKVFDEMFEKAVLE